MAVTIADVRTEHCPAVRLIGKSYQGRGNWKEWQANNWFAEFDGIPCLSINQGGFVGAMHVVDGMVEYWIGRFCLPDAEVPKGFSYVDIAPLEYAVFRLSSKDETVFSFETHNLCLEKLKAYHLTRKEDDWCFERHCCPASEDGIFEYAVSIVREDV